MCSLVPGRAASQSGGALPSPMDSNRRIQRYWSCVDGAAPRSRERYERRGAEKRGGAHRRTPCLPPEVDLGTTPEFSITEQALSPDRSLAPQGIRQTKAI